MHCILNVRISLYKTHTEKVQYKTQRLFEWRVFRKSPSRGISLTSRAPWVAVYISRAAAAATGVSRAMKW